jgi:phosphoinositide-3-kinase, regulatory subunit 4
LVSVLRLDNAFVFPEYLLRAFQQFVTTSEKKRQSPWVRATYATCLGSLASTASRYLDIVQTEPSNESTISESQYQNLYDVARLDLIEQFENHTKALLTDTDPSVRRALLPSVSTLCVFFGKAKASYVILSYLNTYINDRDWMLKSAFFEAIVGVATYMGTAVLEEFILPLMVQALTDPEEFVVERVIRSFSSIADLGIFQASTIWELIDTVARFTMHPNMNIREAATHFIAASAKFASIADQSCIIAPLIKDYLKVQPASLSEVYLLEVLKRPLPRNVMNLAAHWAVNNRKSLFWKGVEQQKVFTFGFGENVTLPPRKRSTIKALARMPKNEQDEHEIENLRKGGLVSEDEFKLLALQEYIWRTVHRKAQEELLKQEDLFSDINTITSLGLEPQTIIFENKQTADRVAAWDLDHPTESRTIADAIQDATSTDVAPKAQRTSSMQSTKPTDIPNMKKSTDAADTLRSPTNKPIDRLQEASSFDSKRSLTINDQQIQKKGSAMSLMGLRESTSKATADISTDTTNAFGKVDRTHSRDDVKKKPLPFVNGKRIKPVHSYTGNDPNVLRLLDSLYLDQYPIDVIEFGQVIPAPRGEPLRRGGTNPHRGLWQLEGTLIAMLGEHRAGINRVIVSPDHKFFITGSDDGTVKVWDVGRLERTVHHRAKNTHVQGTNVRVTSLAFVDNTHCFISTGSDGSVHLVRVECSDKNTPSGGGMQYGKLYMVREYQLPEGEFAVWSEHYKQDIRSMMILATNKSKIYAVDLRTMEVVYQLSNPMNHGTPTCFCVDREGHWLLLGTSHGVLDLWDLRFKLRVRSWGFSHGSPIHRILPPLRTSTSTSKKSRVMIAGGAPGTISVLDIEKNLLREVYKTALPTPPPPSSSDASPTPKKHHAAKPHTTDLPVLVDLDAPDNQPGGVLSRFRGSSIAMDGGRLGAAAASGGAGGGAPDLAVRAITMGAHVHDTGTEPRYTYILSAGPDWKVRFWDAKWPEQSCVVSGLESDEGVPSFFAQAVGETSVVVEEIGKAMVGGAELAANRTPEGKKRKEKGSVVSLQQQSLLRGHKDVVMDVAVVEIPYGMVVSVDRAGMVYVWA